MKKAGIVTTLLGSLVLSSAPATTYNQNGSNGSESRLFKQLSDKPTPFYTGCIEDQSFYVIQIHHLAGDYPYASIFMRRADGKNEMYKKGDNDKRGQIFNASGRNLEAYRLMGSKPLGENEGDTVIIYETTGNSKQQKGNEPDSRKRFTHLVECVEKFEEPAEQNAKK